MYYIYMLRCEDNSLYTGITTDLERRMTEHFSKDSKCAKYTYRHTAKRLERVFITETRKDASKLEFYIKRLNKSQKEDIVKNAKKICYLKEKIDTKLYKTFRLLRKEF